MTTNRKWTAEEDSRLFSQVKAYPQNLTRCFAIVAEELHRTPAAVSNHWYNVTSKMPQYVGFVTISGKHKSINRKNGLGERSSETVFKRVLRILHLL